MPPSVAARSSARARRASALPAASRSSSSTARASSKRSITAWESVPSASSIPAERSRSASAIPSARSRSVVGHTQQVAAAAPRIRKSAWLEVRAVDGGEAIPDRIRIGREQRSASLRTRGALPRSRRAAPRRGRGAARSARPPTTPPSRPSPDRRRGRCGSPHRSGHRHRPRGTDACRPAFGVPVAEAPLGSGELLPDAAVQVAGVEQGDADPGLARGVDHGTPMAFGSS